ncbi:hypothetical protein QBC34DRAFT_459018 [Podospora aff. communis PSN243]|uniref:MARVEL domain-containing protein n=1 Tax=Podospora aff. communis PSN243 TaxID=3040156 RepID=A0AAV9GU78_9PEZI|nr:hypothetical protein QBC34DRAFT_459018 [Podospora aff. communis PSN243]
MGIWAMRPRVALLNLLWSLTFHERFVRSMQDAVVSEALLNWVTVALAMHLRAGLEGDGYGCRQPKVWPDSRPWANMFGALSYSVFAACSSAFQVVLLLLKMFLVFVTATGPLATGWVFWHGFIDTTGDRYCPGSSTGVGVGVVFGVMFLINALLRPLFGGMENREGSSRRIHHLPVLLPVSRDFPTGLLNRTGAEAASS